MLKIPMYKKGDLVEWYTEEDIELPTLGILPANVGIILGFWDSDTGERVPEEYDGTNAVIEASVLQGERTVYKYIHELKLLSAVGTI